jgi:hypothetical protein
MPKFLLTSWQVNSLLHYGSLPMPGPGSPLRALVPSARPLAPGDPDFATLVEKSLLCDNGRGGWRTNFGLLPFLGAAVQPDEVLSLGVGDPKLPGFTVARRNDILVEATLGQGGLTKLEFPLTRTAVILTIIGALSGDRPEPASTGFRFVGGAAEAFVLAAALREFRLDGVPLTVERLRRAVSADLRVTALAAPFAVAGAAEGINRLVNEPAAIDDAIESLVDGGHLRARLDRLEPADVVKNALSGRATAVVGVGRTEVIDGTAKSTSITATRVGDHILSFRVRSQPGRERQFEWAEVSRAQLRWLAFAVLLPTDELERLQRGATLEEVTAAPAVTSPPETEPDEPETESAAPVEVTMASVSTQPPAGTGIGAVAEAPVTTAAPAETPLARPEPGAPTRWTPDHTVPDVGMWAYAEPDPGAAPVAPLDPRLPVQVDERLGDWAHVVCSNGWTCWVDGRQLTSGA